MAAIEAVRERATEEELKEVAKDDLELRFEQVASILRNLDIDKVWAAADPDERRILIEELIEWVTVFPDHLEVQVTSAPPLNVFLSEVGSRYRRLLVSEAPR